MFAYGLRGVKPDTAVRKTVVVGESFSRRHASYVRTHRYVVNWKGNPHMIIVYLVAGAAVVCGCLFIAKARRRG
jgi:hypothetical protein